MKRILLCAVLLVTLVGCSHFRGEPYGKDHFTLPEMKIVFYENVDDLRVEFCKHTRWACCDTPKSCGVEAFYRRPNQIHIVAVKTFGRYSWNSEILSHEFKHLMGYYWPQQFADPDDPDWADFALRRDGFCRMQSE